MNLLTIHVPLPTPRPMYNLQIYSDGIAFFFFSVFPAIPHTNAVATHISFGLLSKRTNVLLILDIK